jgi:hypothetical protein
MKNFKVQTVFDHFKFKRMKTAEEDIADTLYVFQNE